MIIPTEVPMPEDWKLGAAERIFNAVFWGNPEGFDKVWADEFKKFQKENKRGEFFESVDQKHQED